MLTSGVSGRENRARENPKFMNLSLHFLSPQLFGLEPKSWDKLARPEPLPEISKSSGGLQLLQTIVSNKLMDIPG